MRSFRGTPLSLRSCCLIASAFSGMNAWGGSSLGRRMFSWKNPQRSLSSRHIPSCARRSSCRSRPPPARFVAARSANGDTGRLAAPDRAHVAKRSTRRRFSSRAEYRRKPSRPFEFFVPAALAATWASAAALVSCKLRVDTRWQEFEGAKSSELLSGTQEGRNAGTERSHRPIRVARKNALTPSLRSRAPAPRSRPAKRAGRSHARRRRNLFGCGSAALGIAAPVFDLALSGR